MIEEVHRKREHLNIAKKRLNFIKGALKFLIYVSLVPSILYLLIFVDQYILRLNMLTDFIVILLMGVQLIGTAAAWGIYLEEKFR